MTIRLHHLKGCSPAPLALYLKAIGILRLVAEQVDPDARGWWQDEQFCLLTKLDATELERFFLEVYAPTPFLSPWNKGSGFYKENDPGLAPVENSVAARFGRFRDAVRETCELLAAERPRRCHALHALHSGAPSKWPAEDPASDSSAIQTAAWRPLTGPRHLEHSQSGQGAASILA